MVTTATTVRNIRLIVETIITSVTHRHAISRHFTTVSVYWSVLSMCVKDYPWVYCAGYTRLDGIGITFQIEELFMYQLHIFLRQSKIPDFFAAK